MTTQKCHAWNYSRCSKCFLFFVIFSFNRLWFATLSPQPSYWNLFASVYFSFGCLMHFVVCPFCLICLCKPFNHSCFCVQSVNFRRGGSAAASRPLCHSNYPYLNFPNSQLRQHSTCLPPHSSPWSALHWASATCPWFWQEEEAASSSSDDVHESEETLKCLQEFAIQHWTVRQTDW